MARCPDTSVDRTKPSLRFRRLDRTSPDGGTQAYTRSCVSKGSRVPVDEIHGHEHRVLAVAARAAISATPAELAAIMAALADYERAHRDGHGAYRADVAFHASLAVACHNVAFRNVLEGVGDLLLNARQLTDKVPGAISLALEELLADVIVGEARLGDLPTHWREWAAELTRRYRQALLAHRDGATVVTGTYAAEPATLDFAEALVAAILAGGLPERQAAWTCWSLIYVTLGLTQEEQALPGRFTIDLDVGQRPALRRVATTLAESSFVERFEFGVARILG